MFEYIRPKDGPVIETLEAHEVVYAKEQPEYIRLRVLRSTDPECAVLSRWSPTSEQRKAIADGADIYLELLTFRQPLQPIRMMVSDRMNPEYFEILYELNRPNCTATAKA